VKKAIAAVVLLAGVLAAAQLGPGSPAQRKNEGSQNRELSGKVLTKSDAPLPDAVVYLKNTKTLAVKTFIAQKDGGFRFPALSSNVDYEVYAEYKGEKSDTKTVSSFDSRPQVYMNLKVDVKQ
jgi:hypothetical protein